MKRVTTAPPGVGDAVGVPGADSPSHPGASKMKDSTQMRAKAAGSKEDSTQMRAKAAGSKEDGAEMRAKAAGSKEDSAEKGAKAAGSKEDGAEKGVSAASLPRRWYVAVVSHNSEKKVAERLAGLGQESWVASQKVRRIWRNGRKATVDRVVIPSKVFVKCTEPERREIVKLPFISRFLSDRALSGSSITASRLAVIPQEQIDRLRFMLGQSDVPVEITAAPYRPGDRITVVRGSLKGLRGEVVRTADGKTELAVRLDMLGCARLIIDSSDVVPYQD